MAYIFKGTILGGLCRDCIEPLAGLKLKFYRLASDRNVTALAVAAPKDTFSLLDDAAVEARRSLLLGEAEIDERGNFSFEFAKSYDGGPFEVDLHCGTVPRLKPGPRPPHPLQFTITTLQPSWRTVEKDLVAAWEYTVPYRYWCHIRGRFGAWTICGHVLHCETKAPIGGVKVRAFDVDWLQQDALGEDVTDGSGHFRIDYSVADFQKTIFSPSINIELTGGPDLYFRIETLSGTVLLAEPPSRGRLADRENVGPCFCVDLCLEKQPPIPEYLPVFDALGGYLYASDIHSTVPGSGLTNGDNRAFYSTVRLNGLLPKTLNGQPMEYQFEFRPTDASGNPAGPWTVISPAQFASTALGKLERYAPAFPGDPNPIKTAWVYADPAVPGGGPVNAVIAGRLDPRAAGQQRVRAGRLLLTQRQHAERDHGQPGGLTGHQRAGGPRRPEQHRARGAARPKPAYRPAHARRGRRSGKPGRRRHLRPRRHREHGLQRRGQGRLVGALDGQRPTLRLLGGRAPAAGRRLCRHHQRARRAVHRDPSQSRVGVARMAGPGGPYGFTLPPPVPGERFGTATNGFVIGSLADCAYIITLSVSLQLTTGDSIPNPIHDQIGFCKK